MNVRVLALLIASCGLAGGFTRGFAGVPPNQDQQTVEPAQEAARPNQSGRMLPPQRAGPAYLTAKRK